MLYKFRGIVAILCLLIPFVLYAKMPKNVQDFEKLPRSIAKDYYIYRFLRENTIKSEDAQKLLEQTKRVNFKLFYLFAKKLNDKGFTKVAKCLKLRLNDLLKQDNECIAIGLNVSKALALDKKDIKNLAKRLKDYKKLSSTLRVLSYPDVMSEALKNSKKFIGIFNSANSKYRKKIFDKELSKKEINKLAIQKRFNRSIEIIVLQKNLKNLKKSLLLVNPNQNLTQKSLFYLALNALKHKKKNLALDFLDSTYKKAYYRFDKDKVLFWKYLITKDRKYLKKLETSFDINLYTIFAREKLSTTFENIITPQVKNQEKNYDIQNPFLWIDLRQKIKHKKSKALEKMAKGFEYRNTISQYSFIMQKASRYKKHYFPIPFNHFLDNYTNKRKSLILAIAKQESNFIPASISTSYALGMMQFMPFLARAIAKNQKIKNFDLDDMFDPKISYKFANLHLNFLVKKLHNPLFIAYAYNGGIGYTRRLLKRDYFKKGEYEPYLSMELISYPETRRYGKKVLANYIIYMQLLGEKVSLDELIRKLKNPYGNITQKPKN